MNRVSELIAQYRALQLHSVVDYDKFNHYAITHHSTVLEGSTLTAVETDLLLHEGTTPKGKPLAHSLMAKDHYAALLFVLDAAQRQTPVSVAFLQQIGAQVMKNTGQIIHSPLGTVDVSRGEWRKGNVRAGNHYFIAYDKVPAAVQAFVARLADDLQKAGDAEAQLTLSFSAHFDLVSIHPFYDGNGRTSRLLMNYVQAFFRLPPGIVFQEDRADYIAALNTGRQTESKQPFYDFMLAQYRKYLHEEITKYRTAQQAGLPKQGMGFGLFF